MINRLQPILLQKEREVMLLKQHIQQDNHHPIAHFLHGEHALNASPSFKQALQSPQLAVIAEIKRKSPSKGALACISDPIELAQRYIAGGASAISILTDETFFGGHLNDLKQVANSVQTQHVPTLRKDFMIDKLQIAEAALTGASAVLLIVAVLGKETKTLLEFARKLNIDALVEVHDDEELQIALDCGADIIGINNRNLNTFTIDTTCAFELRKKIPDAIITVAESGIHQPTLAQQYHQAGFDAVLIGEALVKSDNPESFIQACRHE